MERRLAAILAADVVGYSRLIRADEEGTIAALRTLRAELIDPTLGRHNGRIVKLMGDGMLAEFPSVVDAVRAAVETQQILAEHNSAQQADKRIEFRVGINLGDVVIDGDDIHGDGVNVAARLEGLAQPGGVCISGGVHEQVRDRLDLPFEDMGEREVKNIVRPVRVWKWTPNGADLEVDDVGAEEPLPPLDKPSIAVLAFDNMSRDGEFEFFGDGLAEDIITTLSKIDALFVIARNSSFAYKDKAADVRQIGVELGVRFVLEGSVRISGSRMRVTAQLINADDGAHLWAERYDRGTENIFDIQDEITREIVTALRAEISDGDQARIWLRGTDSVEAWLLAMQGHELLFRGNPIDMAQARNLLEKARNIDPTYVTAIAGLARFHGMSAHFGFTDDREETLSTGAALAQEALEIDPMSSLALSAKALFAAERQHFDEAIPDIRRAMALSPGDAMIKSIAAWMLIKAGELAEAETVIREAMRLNPHGSVIYNGILANSLEMQGRNEEAMAMLRQAVARNPDYFSGHLRLSSLYGLNGDIETAKMHAAEARRINPRVSREAARDFYANYDEVALDRFLHGLVLSGLIE